jgi:hypothetical protein
MEFSEPPVPMPNRHQLDPLQFKDLQIALLQQRLAQATATQAVQQASQQVETAFRAAGLDATKRYQLNEADFSATEA